ncbi:uncharacterized protein LOC119683451 [Teleopsis dalmanni]|uniref:uncharacterized protein LOC119683451 n=1 Tax=Teleopsis dalmanni TaxID=139649 RepID=UPI0018CDDCCA|nr:uncharacterized protein LOC119683451 [Teleopsis dalmanni]
MTFALGDTLWKCELCGANSSISDIAALKSNIEDEINGATGDMVTLESLLQKYSKILHTNHFLLIRIKHNILMILNEILFHKKAEELKERKIQLHEEILPLVRLVSPGISKLYAFELHDYLSSFIQLDRNYIPKDSIADKKNAYKILNIMEEVCKNLAYELPNTQEGVLLQQLLSLKKTVKAQVNSSK